jgi:hypothetical protein
MVWIMVPKACEKIKHATMRGMVIPVEDDDDDEASDVVVEMDCFGGTQVVGFL